MTEGRTALVDGGPAGRVEGEVLAAAVSDDGARSLLLTRVDVGELRCVWQGAPVCTFRGDDTMAATVSPERPTWSSHRSTG